MTPNERDTRNRKIGAGKLWQISTGYDPEEVVFEGSKTRCLAWLSTRNELRKWRRGKSAYRLGQLIWEK
jgi:hypothetical protein